VPGGGSGCELLEEVAPVVEPAVLTSACIAEVTGTDEASPEVCKTKPHAMI